MVVWTLLWKMKGFIWISQEEKTDTRIIAGYLEDNFREYQ